MIVSSIDLDALCQDYELNTEMSVGMIYGSLIRLMTRRLLA